MWELDHKEGWALKNWCFWTVLLEKTLESPLDCKEIQPVHPKGNQSRIFIGRIDAEAETQILWPPDVKSWLIGKDPDAGKDWGQKEKVGDRRWDGWMASPTQWTWVWANSGRWWRTRKPGMLQSMGLPRVGHDLATECQQQWFKNVFEIQWFFSLGNICNVITGGQETSKEDKQLPEVIFSLCSSWWGLAYPAHGRLMPLETAGLITKEKDFHLKQGSLGTEILPIQSWIEWSGSSKLLNMVLVPLRGLFH